MLYGQNPKNSGIIDEKFDENPKNFDEIDEEISEVVSSIEIHKDFEQQLEGV